MGRRGKRSGRRREESRRRRTERRAQRQRGSRRGRPDRGILMHGPRTVHACPTMRADNLGEISAHIQEQVGEVAFVMHELKSDLVHVDVHVVAPTASRPWTTLVTSGMSESPMIDKSCPDHPRLRYAELMLGLPPDWPLSLEALADPRTGWPVSMLRDLARFPHAHDTWLAQGHSLGDDKETKPFGPSNFKGCVLFPPLTLPPEATVLRSQRGFEIDFLAVYPLYREELKFKRRRDTFELMERFRTLGVTEVVDLRRPNACLRRRGSSAA